LLSTATLYRLATSFSSHCTRRPPRPTLFPYTTLFRSLQMRDVRHYHRILREERGGEDRQRCVLGAGDAYFAFEGHTALDLELIHIYWLKVACGAFSSHPTGCLIHAGKKRRSCPRKACRFTCFILQPPRRVSAPRSTAR